MYTLAYNKKIQNIEVHTILTSPIEVQRESQRECQNGITLFTITPYTFFPGNITFLFHINFYGLAQNITHTYTRTHARTHTHIHPHPYTHTHTHAHTHTHTHTHTPEQQANQYTLTTNDSF